jgi:hypothetical protein
MKKLFDGQAMMMVACALAAHVASFALVIR